MASTPSTVSVPSSKSFKLQEEGSGRCFFLFIFYSEACPRKSAKGLLFHKKYGSVCFEIKGAIPRSLTTERKFNMKATVTALLALCFILLGVNDAAAGTNKKGKGVPTVLVPNPVDGECGSNATSFVVDATAFSGTFCKVGEQSSASIGFPEAGSNSLWTCEGQKGGKSAACVASREAPNVVAFKLPPPPPVVLECKWVAIPASVQYEPARTFVVPGLLINTNCGKQTVWLNGTQYTQPAQVLNHSGMQLVCPPSN